MVKLGIIKEDNIMSDNTNNGFPVPEEPLTREEQYLSAIAGVTEATEIPEKPLTRVEAYLDKIVENGGGGGGGGTVNNAKITIQKNGTDVESFTLNQSTDETINISGIAEADSNGQIEAAIVKAGALEDGMTATTQATSDDSTKLATTAYVHDVVDALPEPMIFTGSITLTADSTDTSTAAITVSAPASAADIVKGYTYKVTSIASSPVYTGSIKVGDTLIAAKNAPTVSASWVADTDWTIVPSGDETGYVVGLPSGTSSGQLMAFGADGYTAANSGVSVANNTTGISDVDTAVPTSKAVIHKTAHAATLDDYTPETGTYTDKITTADTIDSAIKKLDTRSRANETNILTFHKATGTEIYFSETEPTGTITEGSYWISTNATKVYGDTTNMLDMSTVENHYTLDGTTGLPTIYSGGSDDRCATTTPIDVADIQSVVVTYNSDVSGLNFIYSILDANNSLIERKSNNISGNKINMTGAKYLYLCWYKLNGTITTANITNGSVIGKKWK